MWKPQDPGGFEAAYRSGATNDELVRLSGGTLNTVLKYVKHEQDNGNLPRRITRVPKSGMPKFNKALKLPEGKYAITGDSHSPFYSEKWWNRLIEHCEQEQIRELIVAGDGLDMHAFSPWGADPKLSWDTEAKATAKWLWQLYHHFDKIWWTTGNHEDRLCRKTDWQMTANTIIAGLLSRYADDHNKPYEYEPKRINWSGYRYCTIGGKWRITHPKNYSKLPLKVANELALKHTQHVICAHGHHAAKGWAENGRNVIIDLGGMFDESSVEYYSKSDTTHPAWNPGYVLYDNGCAELYCNEPFSRWAE